MMRYPPQIRYHVEQELKQWKAKYQEQEAFIKQMLAGKEEQRLRILELLKIQEEFAALRAKVEKEAIAAINKEMLMKKQIHELYK